MWSWGGDWDAFVQKAVTLVWNFFVVSRRCCIDFFDGLAVFGLRWAIARGFPVLQKYSLPCAISPIHAQPTCIYICRNPRVARNTYIQNSYSQGIPVQYTSRVPPHTHILGYTFWKRPDARFPTLARTRPIGREQLRDPLLQRRAVKGSEVAAFPQFCRSFFGLHTLPLNHRIVFARLSGFGYLPHVSACADCPAS
jgi:hypothetical protein